MLTRIHQKLGTAGFIISIVALIAALGGGAYAASGGLTGKQKKEVTKIAQTEAKKYAGKTGAPGANGPAGPQGAAGANGTNGTNGLDGANGKSVVLGNGASGCTTNGGAGGTSVEVAGEPSTKKYVCNGTTGFASELPSGETETGVWSIGKFTELQEEKGTQTLMPISYPFPVTPGEYTTIYLAPGSPAVEHCEGSAESPTADPGYLCIYALTGTGGEYLFTLNPENGEAFAGSRGAVIAFGTPLKNKFLYGTWAVTAH